MSSTVSWLAAGVGLIATLAACASMPAPTCEVGERLAIHDSLYFGTGTPTGTVTPQEWAEFLRNTVTPRFPQGLTVSQASGEWRGADGALVRESSHILTLVHPDDALSETSVLELVASYKERFQQEAVLRVKVRACVSF
jgi:Protein of unknown function (DUF3574)